MRLFFDNVTGAQTHFFMFFDAFSISFLHLMKVLQTSAFSYADLVCIQVNPQPRLW